MQEDTCTKEKCKLWDLFDGECPNRVTMWWENQLTKQKKAVDDCAPKRTVLMLQDIHNRLVATQKSAEEMRNEAVWVQVVAEVLGKNSGVDLGSFVMERQRLIEVQKLKELEEVKKFKELEEVNENKE